MVIVMSTPATLVIRNPGHQTHLGLGHINKLPDELLLAILTFADDEQLLACARMCRRWYWLVQTVFQRRLNPSMLNRLGAEELYPLDKDFMSEGLLTNKGKLATVPSVTFFYAKKFCLNQEVNVPEALRRNIPWLFRALPERPNIFFELPQELKGNRLLARCVLEKDGLYFQHIADNLKHSRALALTAVKSAGDALQQMRHFKDDDEIVRQALLSQKAETSPLQFASERLQNTFAFAELACTGYPDSFGFIGPQLKVNNQTYQYLLNLALEGDGIVLKFVPEQLRTPQLCLKAVRSNGLALCFVPEEQQTHQIVMAAVTNEGAALEYAVPEFQNDPDICEKAVESNGEALEFVPEHLCTKPLVLSALAQTLDSLDYVPEALVNDRDIALSAVAISGHCLVEFNDELRKDALVCLTAICQCLGADAEGFNGGGLSEVFESMDFSLFVLLQMNGCLNFVRQSDGSGRLEIDQSRESCQALLESLRQGEPQAVFTYNHYLPEAMQPQAAMPAP